MNSISVHQLSSSSPLSFLFLYISYTFTFFLLAFSYLTNWKKCLWFDGCHHTSTEHCRSGQLRLLSFLAAFSGCERDHQWHQRDWSRLMKSPDANSHHNHLMTSKVWFCYVNVLWHFLYLSHRLNEVAGGRGADPKYRHLWGGYSSKRIYSMTTKNRLTWSTAGKSPNQERI